MISWTQIAAKQRVACNVDLSPLNRSNGIAPLIDSAAIDGAAINVGEGRCWAYLPVPGLAGQVAVGLEGLGGGFDAVAQGGGDKVDVLSGQDQRR